MIKIFAENGEFSWRKCGTGICYLVFGTANVGYLITHDFNELPSSYLAIIAGVFVFYFGKTFLRGMKITNVDTRDADDGPIRPPKPPSPPPGYPDGK